MKPWEKCFQPPPNVLYQDLLPKRVPIINNGQVMTGKQKEAYQDEWITRMLTTEEMFNDDDEDDDKNKNKKRNINKVESSSSSSSSAPNKSQKLKETRVGRSGPALLGVKKIRPLTEDVRTIDLYKSAIHKKRRHGQPHPPIKATLRDLDYAKGIDRLRRSLLDWMTPANKNYKKRCVNLRRVHPELQQREYEEGDWSGRLAVPPEPSIRCDGIQFRGEVSTSKTEEELKEEPKLWGGSGGLPWVHVFISTEEEQLIPFFYGFPCVTIAPMNPADYVIVANDRILTAWERKDVSDLSSCIKSGKFEDQRERLKELAIPRYRIRYLQEGDLGRDHYALLPRTTLQTAAANVGRREGFSWDRTDSVLHTVYMIYSELMALVKYGDFHDLHQTTESTSTESEYRLAKPKIPAGYLPHQRIDTSTIIPLLLSAFPGSSFAMAQAMAEAAERRGYTTLLQILQAWETEPDLFSDVTFSAEKLYAAKARKAQYPNKKRKIGKRCQKMHAILFPETVVVAEKE